jgi:predicted deacylase
MESSALNIDLPPLEVLPRDLSAYRSGTVGVEYVHRFESGVAGPHVLVNALTHGNEFCGMVAACHLLDNGIRPRIGTLTVSFSNVAAYESFDPVRPFESRQITHNFNRIWSTDWLDGDQDSVELRRARAIRPVVAAADHLLDLHSTSQDVAPFWVYPAHSRNAALASALAQPDIHLVMPQGIGSGVPLIEHGGFGLAKGTGIGLVAECGQHFKRSSSDLAIAVTLDFLGHFGLIDREPTRPGPHRRLELLRTHVIASPDFAFVRPLVGFETFARDELIAIDGHDEIRAPCDDCTVMMPTRAPIVGREGVYLTRPI